MPKPCGSSATSRTISAMAVPVLTPGAPCPLISIADTPLKRSRRGEPYSQREVAKDESGTIRPWSLRTDQRLKSSGFMRNGASACTYTRFTRPRSVKSSMY